MQVKNIGTEKGLQKIKHFCAYQERSHMEVKQKLYTFGLYKQEVETLVSLLIEEGFLNEERYATAFAGGKFRMKQWGRVKIKYELKQRGIGEFCIKKALSLIDEKAYFDTLNKLCLEKINFLRNDKNIYARKAKLHAYLAQKGYEIDLINTIIQKAVKP